MRASKCLCSVARSANLHLQFEFLHRNHCPTRRRVAVEGLLQVSSSARSSYRFPELDFGKAENDADMHAILLSWVVLVERNGSAYCMPNAARDSKTGIHSLDVHQVGSICTNNIHACAHEQEHPMQGWYCIQARNSGCVTIAHW